MIVWMDRSFEGCFADPVEQATEARQYIFVVSASVCCIEAAAVLNWASVDLNKALEVSSCQQVTSDVAATSYIKSSSPVIVASLMSRAMLET